jgi:hypothetical protein
VLLAEHHREFLLCHHLNWENITNGKYMVILGLCQKDGFDIRDHKKNIKLRKPCPLTSFLSDLGKDYHCSMQWWSNWVQYVNTKFLPGHSLGSSYYLSRESNSMLRRGVKLREVMFWARNGDDDMKRKFVVCLLILSLLGQLNN